MVDVRSQKLLSDIDSSFTFLCWAKDSSIIFQKEKEHDIEIFLYQIKNNSYCSVGKVSNPSEREKYINSDIVALPHRLEDPQHLFFLFMKENKLYKYCLAEKVAKEISNYVPLKGSVVNNVSVNDDCSVISVSQRNEEYGTISKIVKKQGRVVIIEKSKFLTDKACYAYFLQNNNKIIYYKVLEKLDGIRKIEIISYDVRSGAKREIAIVKCVSLINPFMICPKHELIINNVNPQNFRFEIKGTVLSDFLASLMKSLSFIEIKL